MNSMRSVFDTRVATQSGCPICGHPLDRFEQLLAQNDSNFQCRHCWTRIGPTNGNGKKMHAIGNGKHRRR
jgi:transcription initiation factor IIE alpha subunit